MIRYHLGLVVSATLVRKEPVVAGVTVCRGIVLVREVGYREVEAAVIHFSTKTRTTCPLQLVVVVEEGVKVEPDWSMCGNVVAVVD